MISRIRRSAVLTLFTAMVVFGLFMGLVFPLVVSPFVEWKAGMRVWFSLLSIVAGITVGGVSIALVRAILLVRIRLVGGQLRAISDGQGHLSSRIEFTSDDDLGSLVDSFNLLLQKLQSSVEKIRGVSLGISDLSTKTGETSQMLSRNTEEKTQLVVDTAISIDSLESSFQEMSTKLKELLSSSEESRVATASQVDMIEKVNGQVRLLLQHCQSNSEGVSKASTASHKTVKYSQELTTALTETAASMTEMDQTIREIDRSLQETSTFSEKVATDAGVGKEASWKTQKGMNRISESFDASIGVIQSFSEKVREIAAITEVIDEVTDQTNLLALNAAIIAAQAGEHGRGFAVVADQIKRLADQTSQSTREIGGLIKTFQDQAFQAISSTTEIHELVTEGVSLSDKAGTALDSILESAAGTHQQIRSLEAAIREIASTSTYLSEKVDGIAGRSGEIATANREQEAGMATVSQTVEETRSVASFLSESAREQTAASKRVREQMDIVSKLVDDAKHSIEQGERETGELVGTIQKIQQISRLESDTMAELDQEGQRLDSLYRELRDEVGRLAPEKEARSG